MLFTLHYLLYTFSCSLYILFCIFIVYCRCFFICFYTFTNVVVSTFLLILYTFEISPTKFKNMITSTFTY
nr:MAG TPA: hypothetical protein [Caudoviricetes sp.]